MKKFILPLLVVGAMFAAPVANAQKVGEKQVKAAKGGAAAYAVQPQLSTLGWVGKKVGGQHNGTISVKDGAVQVKGNQIVGGTFAFDMNSIKVADLTDPEWNGKLVGHLKNDDFFAVDKNPTATFVITSIKPLKGDANGNNAQISGNLSIKGKTNPVTFPAKVGVKDGVASASGVATVDRTKYDVKYGSTLFGAAADKAIEDNFTLSFNVIAKQQAN
ncbi:YceI family protein [Hymenobacter busanensis]|uniref:YceI family protein n=1 Tax=Hymenobacter busanensis TaxID=2607656 RepID=A0A7L4ZW42_9BACT|nr:YceI family protein [Hymenobacter busanensis]KAA9332449.1 YceI family protein [Hymenobacter busanensis]QHJ07213.1 YceI family protein [Hymenobacter busanensis]